MMPETKTNLLCITSVILIVAMFACALLFVASELYGLEWVNRPALATITFCLVLAWCTVSFRILNGLD